VSYLVLHQSETVVMGSNPGRSWMYISVFLFLLHLVYLEALRDGFMFCTNQKLVLWVRFLDVVGCTSGFSYVCFISCS